jgi:carboxypeptidase Taq
MTSEETKSELSSNYDELVSKLRAIAHLEQAQSVLNYDRMVFMPKAPESAMARGAQLAALASVIHEKSTDKALMTLLEKAEQEASSNEKNESETDNNKDNEGDKRRILELTRTTLEQTARIPAALAAKKAQHGAMAHGAWAKAREAKDFSAFVPALTTCFDIATEEAGFKRGSNNNTSSIGLYDQMLDDFEMGMTATRIDQVFDQIETALVPLLALVSTSGTAPPTDPLLGTFPIDVQKEICRDLVTSLGFDESHGRIDVAVHPFTSSSSPADVRITSRFSTNEWVMGVLATIHEGGHAMYEQNLGPSGLEIDKALSMGVHESQSLFWERHVAKSQAFWNWATPKLQQAYEGFEYTPEQVYSAINTVKTDNLIRVEADELTYPLHVLLRYRLERDIIGGTLAVKDIPTAWNKMFQELLGTNVPDDAQGCLQDIHWSAFAIGYFPTYLLGSTMSAQLAHYCQQDIPDMWEQIEDGKFTAIKEWLTNKVHKHGKRYKSLDALLEAELGEPLNPKYYIDYLGQKYKALYQC